MRKSSPLKKPGKPGGRPAKFSEPSRPVTVTLPERVLQWLAAVDADRAKAITKLVDSSLRPREKVPKWVEVVQVAPGKALILVGHSQCLQRIPWVQLIEVAPAKNLISVRSGTSIESIEVAIHDLLEDLPEEETQEREILEGLRRLLRESRRGEKTTKEEILFVQSGD